MERRASSSLQNRLTRVRLRDGELTSLPEFVKVRRTVFTIDSLSKPKAKSAFSSEQKSVSFVPTLRCLRLLA
jgi:hypothetical protein